MRVCTPPIARPVQTRTFSQASTKTPTPQPQRSRWATILSYGPTSTRRQETSTSSWDITRSYYKTASLLHSSTTPSFGRPTNDPSYVVRLLNLRASGSPDHHLRSKGSATRPRVLLNRCRTRSRDVC